MERLISSSLPSRTITTFPRPRLLAPRVSSVARFGLPSLPHHGFKPLRSLVSKHEGPPTPLRLSPVAGTSLPVSGEDKGRESYPSGEPSGASRLGDNFVQKVASAAFIALLSTLIVTTIQSVLAPPAYATFQSAAKTSGGLIRTELLSSAWTGFFAGCLHTLSGPDHLAALAPLSIGRTRMESAVVGALWGCGHDAGQVIFGLLFLVLKDRLHIEIIRTWGTRVVGLTLLVIGAIGIREASEVPAPCVALENGECDVSLIEPLDAAPGGKKKIGFATFATGIVHGLQPDALMMVLPALALPSRLAGAAFLGMFLLGTVVAMGSYTVFIGSCTQALKERIPRITEKLTWAASLVAISMGLGILISQFFGFSLY
ncbi:chloroplast protein FOR GROWTH AND FERTILITY 2-like [Typha angustifolia]|uniref:chloroplast protein FOR GROWTH AND FERTILITY 2-like n=1 Tax=Typha angustifolia TaxID=59011 RepID=UPI003C2D7778